jgi:hypothetical protein
VEGVFAEEVDCGEVEWSTAAGTARYLEYPGARLDIAALTEYTSPLNR